MDEITREKVRRAMVELGIDLGHDGNRPVNINRARATLDRLERDLGLKTDSVSLLRIETRTASVLEDAGIETVEQLRALTDLELLAIPLLRGARLYEVKSALVAFDESR
jgi:DNA-directed RNA polymerase alpha subunit